MKDFIIELYSNENFPIYLGCIIAVLLVAFFVVLFLGRKDMKKHIAQLENSDTNNMNNNVDNNAFKEVSEPVKVESPIVNESLPVDNPEINKVENETILDQVNLINNPPLPPLEQTENNQNSIEPPFIAPVSQEEPKDLVDSNDIAQNFSTLANSIDEELKELERQQKEAEPFLANSEPSVSLTSETPEVEVAPLESVPVKEESISELFKTPINPNDVEDIPEMNDNVVELSKEPVIENPVINEPVVEKSVINEEVPKPTLFTPVEPKEVKQPDDNSAKTGQATKIVNDVFSSVYVPKKEENNLFDETMSIELPKLKKEDK